MNNDIIQSIALEEAALAHILNAEGEKIQKAVQMDLTIDELLAINKSVSNTIQDVTSLEIVLVNKIKTLCSNDFPVKHSGQIVFLLYDCNTKKPICGAPVKLYDETCEIIIDTSKTNENGIYCKDNLPLTNYILEICDANGQKHIVKFELSTTHHIVFQSGCVNIAPPPPPCVNGCVIICVSNCGTKFPLKDIKVEIYNVQKMLVASGYTDQNGKYCYDNLPSGKYYAILTDVQSKTSLKNIFKIVCNNITELSLCFNDAVCKYINVYGNVFDDCGNPVANATVTVCGNDEVKTVTNACGQYRINNVIACDKFIIYAEKCEIKSPVKTFIVNKQSFKIDIYI